MKNKDIKKAFESITPSNDAKERMLKAIIEKSKAAPKNTSVEPTDIPWYVKFRAQISVGSAAVVCAAVFAITVLSPGIKDIGGKNSFVENQPYFKGTETQTVIIDTEDINNADHNTIYTTSAAAKGLYNINKNSNSTTDVSKETLSTLITESSVTTLKTECKTEMITSTVPSETTQEIVTAQTEASTQTEPAATTSGSNTSLYGNLFDFDHLTWAGKSYATNYSETSYSNIANMLGSGVATDAENRTYTILLYEIKGVPIEDGLAVQYIGQTNYYVFYNV